MDVDGSPRIAALGKDFERRAVEALWAIGIGRQRIEIDADHPVLGGERTQERQDVVGRVARETEREDQGARRNDCPAQHEAADAVDPQRSWAQDDCEERPLRCRSGRTPRKHPGHRGEPRARDAIPPRRDRAVACARRRRTRHGPRPIRSTRARRAARRETVKEGRAAPKGRNATRVVLRRRRAERTRARRRDRRPSVTARRERARASPGGRQPGERRTPRSRCRWG